MNVQGAVALVTLASGGELILREERGGLQVTSVDGRLAIFPAVANRVIVQVVE